MIREPSYSIASPRHEEWLTAGDLSGPAPDRRARRDAGEGRGVPRPDLAEADAFHGGVLGCTLSDRVDEEFMKVRSYHCNGRHHSLAGGVGLTPPRHLRRGEVLEPWVEGIGRMVHRLV